MDSYTSSSTKPIFRARQIIWYVLAVFESLLGIRFFLKLLSANANADFTQLIYAVTAPLVAPFTAVFAPDRFEGSIFEWTTLLALAIYWIIAAGIMKFLVMGKSVSIGEAAEKLEQEE